MRTALLILCLICSPSPSPPNQKSADAAQSKPETDTQPSKPTLPATAEKQSSANASNQNGTGITSAPNERSIRIVGYPPRSAGDTIALVCTILLTIAGIVGIIVAICTLYKIRDQATETAKSAKAAADSVKAIDRQADIMERQTRATEESVKVLIDIERAWLIPTGEVRDLLPEN